MILKTIHCSVKGCDNNYTENKFNEGFPGWGHVSGLKDDRTGEDTAHFCPEHLLMVGRLLNNDLG